MRAFLNSCIEAIKPNRYRIYAWIISSGLVMFAIHNQNAPDWLNKYAFPPQVGLLLSVLFTIMTLYERRRDIDLGKKVVYIPLLVLVGSIGASGVYQYFIGNGPFKEMFAPLIFGFYLFGIYLVARILKRDMILPFTVATIIECISLIVGGLTEYAGIPFGGFLSPSNYDIAVGFIVFGTLISTGKYQWMLAILALVALFFAGAEETYVIMGVLGLALIIRRDWNKKLLIGVGILAVIIGLWFAFGNGDELYFRTVDKVKELVSGEAYAPIIEGSDTSLANRWLHRRLENYELMFTRLSFFGNGFTINKFEFTTVHNVPLIILDQIGIIGALAWTFVVIYALIKTRWKYLWLGIIAMGILDHYIWTQISPYFWMALGLSTSIQVNDKIFGEKDDTRGT